MIPAIRDAVLAYLYDQYFLGHTAGNLHQVRTQLQADDRVFWETIETMQEEALVTPFAMGGTYKIQPAGVDFVETNHLIDVARIQHHQDLRRHILEQLMQVYDTERRQGLMNYQDLAVKIQGDEQEVREHMLMLDQAGLVEAPYRGGNFCLTASGRNVAKRWRINTALQHDFASAQALPPAKRGKALEHVIAAVALRAGWTTESNIVTPGEELDVVIVKDHAYYLVECKWYSKPIEAKYIREFYGKLANRTGFRGLFVSMSGFTNGAIDQVKTYINQHPICCLGLLDVDAVINGTLDFSELVEQRYRRLITQRHVEWS